MTNLLRFFKIRETYSVGEFEGRLADEWMAEWDDKPTVGVVRGARAELIEAIRPFAESYRLHDGRTSVVSKQKQVLAMDVSVDDWKRLADLLSALEV